jgi:hypothetical protein
MSRSGNSRPAPALRQPEDWVGELVEFKWPGREKRFLVRVFDLEVALHERYSDQEKLWYWAKNA